MVATLHLPARPIIALGFALATAIAPTAAVLADIGSPGAYVITADPAQNCTIVQSNGSTRSCANPTASRPTPTCPLNKV